MTYIGAKHESWSDVARIVVVELFLLGTEIARAIIVYWTLKLLFWMMVDGARIHLEGK